MTASDDRYVWLNQYTNPGNWMAHSDGGRARALPYATSSVEPTFSITGLYPVVVYLAYICAGLAIGRLDLTWVRDLWSG